MIGRTSWRAFPLQAGAALVLLVAALCPAAQAADGGVPVSTGLDHPLCAGRGEAAGDICAVVPSIGTPGERPPRRSEATLLDAIVTAIGGARFVLLGEVHDNPAHHRIRAAIVARLAAGDRRPAVVLEHIRHDQQAALDAFTPVGADATVDARSLLAALEWDKTGWPAAAMFEPLFAVLIAKRLPIRPGEPARGVVAKVARSGLAALPDDERARLALDGPLPQPIADAMSAEIAGSHCGLLPAQAVPGMVLAQRFRDAHLADAMISAAGRSGSAILLAGDGHVRADRAVPWHLRQRLPGEAVATVVLAEVETGQPDAESYVPHGPDGRPAADVVILTPRAERADPCEAMRQRGAGKG